VAVKIKLKRMGKIRAPYYRIIVADARAKRDGRPIEEIGKYHPKLDPSLIEIDSGRAQYWLSVGAQPTDPVRRLLEITGDWQRFKGLPGAEGSLKQPAAHADKKDVFAAAVAETLAGKGKADAAKAGEAKGRTREAGGGKGKADAAKAGEAKADAAKGGEAAAGAGKGRADAAKGGEAKAGDGKGRAREAGAGKGKADAAEADPAEAGDTERRARASSRDKPAGKEAEDPQAEPSGVGSTSEA
jgi:small subunit ribosomal protein S16